MKHLFSGLPATSLFLVIICDLLREIFLKAIVLLSGPCFDGLSWLPTVSKSHDGCSVCFCVCPTPPHSRRVLEHFQLHTPAPRADLAITGQYFRYLTTLSRRRQQQITHLQRPCFRIRVLFIHSLMEVTLLHMVRGVASFFQEFSFDLLMHSSPGSKKLHETNLP